MIKNTIVLLVLCCTQFGFAQVGIGTTTPTAGKSLDVNGSLLVQDNFKKVTAFPDEQLTDLDYKFLVRKLDSNPVGEVAQLDLSQIDIAPITVANYVFSNLKKDNVLNADLQYDSSKYIVGLSNVRYEGQYITKGIVGGDYTLIGNFASRTYISGGTWHLEIRNRSRDNAIDDAITYYVTIIIYDRNYFKELPLQTVDMNGSENGSTPIPSGLQ